MSKLRQIWGLPPTEKAILQNYHFMSSRLAGTRQIRNSIRHIVFSSRVFYGAAVFLTLTPSERHSGLAIRLFRGRRRDPAFAGTAQNLVPYLGEDAPSLCPGTEESAVVELPEYDLRRTITSWDPLACVYAFLVMVRVVLPVIFGYRMCPKCPHCATGTDPCMDGFGSNAKAMGGYAGRCDAMVGAVESQKADGVLHIHLFLFLQLAMQFSSLHQLAELLREKLLSAEAWKEYVSYVRCAAYPDAEAHQRGLRRRSETQKGKQSS